MGLHEAITARPSALHTSKADFGVAAVRLPGGSSFLPLRTGESRLDRAAPFCQRPVRVPLPRADRPPSTAPVSLALGPSGTHGLIFRTTIGRESRLGRVAPSSRGAVRLARRPHHLR